MLSLVEHVALSTLTRSTAIERKYPPNLLCGGDGTVSRVVEHANVLQSDECLVAGAPWRSSTSPSSRRSTESSSTTSPSSGPVPRPARCGKSHLATALAILAVEASYRGYFTSADEMVRMLGHALVEGTFNSKLKSYVAPSVLVLIPVGRAEATAFLQVVNRLADRLLHRAIVFNIKRPPWRMRGHQALATVTTSPKDRGKEPPLV